MSVHWSSEILKWEYRELQATAMTVDYTGNNVLLAGRRCLAIKQINQEEDGNAVKKYPRQSKYDAAGAEWCQSYHGQKLCAIAVSILNKKSKTILNLKKLFDDLNIKCFVKSGNSISTEAIY